MTAVIYKNNRKSLIKAKPSADYIFIAGNGNVSRSGDTNYKFRQDSNILYLSGLEYPGICILIDNTLGKSYLVKPTLSRIEEIFEDTPNWDEYYKSADLDAVLTEKQAISLMKQAKNLYMNLPPKQLQYGVFANPNRARWHHRLKRLGLQINDIRPALANLRMIKQAYEIENIKKAISTTNKTLDNIINNISGYITELDIENYISADFAKKGLVNAYLPIVASGKNAAILHHLPSKCKIEKNACLLFDVGAEYNGYSADISRTIVVGQNKLNQNLINDIRQVQEQIISIIKPGEKWKNIHEESVKLINEIILKNNIGNKSDFKNMYPHAIGHFLGLDTHDPGDYSVPLKEGMVLTVEPGVYSKKLGFGIRIENEILITKTGAIIL